MIDMGEFSYFLSVLMTRVKLELLLSQCKYAMDLLERAHMFN